MGNERWDVIGFRRVSFRDEKNDVEIKGYSLYLTRLPYTDSEIDHVQGSICEKVFCSDRLNYTPVVGDVVTIYYNRYGKVGAIEAC